MYIVTSNSRQISLVSSCYDCFACETYIIICRRRFKNLTKSTEISREYPILRRVTVTASNKISSLSCLSHLFL